MNKDFMTFSPNKFPTITKRVILCIILSGVFICSLVFATSYMSFNRHFRMQYDSNISEICAAARECLNPDDFQLYAATLQADEEYESVLKILQDFVDKFELNLIYVSMVEPPDYTHITYIYDPVRQDGKWSPYPLGYQEDYFEPNYNASTKRVFEEGASIVRHTIKTRSGSHITAQLPVYNTEGKIIAVIGAQKNIQEFVNARRSFLTYGILTVIIFATLFIIFFSIYFNLRFIKPIMQITHETNRFASRHRKPSTKLLSLTNRDEIGTLAYSVYRMEDTISANIKSLKNMTTETALSLATAIDAKDTCTHGHSIRAATYARRIARAARKTEAECNNIYLAALLHDVGKIGIPDNLINKRGNLTEEEFEILRTHTLIGKQILQNITEVPVIADGAYYHHERFDGQGYPNGLAGTDIPEIARIITVADAYDAMTSKRSYRTPYTQDIVRSEFEKGRGTQFDPTFTDIILKMIDEDKDYKMRELE